MVEFKFSSTGKFKLAAARLSKIQSAIYFVLNKSSSQVKILTVDSCIKMGISYVTPLNNHVYFSIESSQLHRISKNLSADKDYTFKLTKNSLKIICHFKDKINTITIGINRETTLPEYIISKMTSFNTDMLNYGSVSVDIRNMIWIVEKYEDLFDTICINYQDDILTISGNSENYQGSSIVPLNKNSTIPKTPFTKKIKTRRSPFPFVEYRINIFVGFYIYGQ